MLLLVKKTWYLKNALIDCLKNGERIVSKLNEYFSKKMIRWLELNFKYKNIEKDFLKFIEILIKSQFENLSLMKKLIEKIELFTIL